MSPQRPYDLALFGATGFTGRLTAEYLARRAARDGPSFTWAIAGRNAEKLRAVRQALAEISPAAGEIGILEARTDDPESLERLAAASRVVATTVGPFDRHGEPLVRACVGHGSDYADITGEPAFVSRLLERYHGEARRKGLRIVSCCGFDSVPHDLGALLAVRQLPADGPIHLEGFVRASGALSGGTWHSAVEAMAGLGRGTRSTRSPPPAGERRVRRARERTRYEKRLRSWVVPMPTIDGPIVRRSARALEDYGPDFRYGHYLQIGSVANLAVGAAGLGTVFAMAQLPPTRKLLLSLRRPGQGPDAERRRRSRFRVVFLGRGGGRTTRVEVSGGDPGYGETSKMLAESALALALDRDRLGDHTGVLTPAVALGDALLERLRAAGIRFEVMEQE